MIFPGDEHEFASILCLDDDALAELAAREARDFLNPPSGSGKHGSPHIPPIDPALEWLRDAIPGYLAISTLGRGGMALVVEALELSTGRTVALKIPHENFRASRGQERQRSEIAALSRLDHPAIARLYGVVVGAGPLRDAALIVMERVVGESFSDWLSKDHPIRTRVQAVRDVADAVASAHSSGVLHLDLKADNVLMQANGTPKVLDFGISHLFSESGAADPVTMVTHGFGSLEAIAPEQLDARIASPASDVYALGALLYLAIARQPPLELDGLPLSAAAARIQSQPPRPVRSIAKSTPRDLEVIAHVALAKDARDRYPSAAAFRDDLDRWLSGRTVKARPTPLPARVARFIRRHPRSVAIALAVGGTLSAIAAVALTQSHIAARQRARADSRSDELADLASSLVLDVTPMLLYIDGATQARARIAEDGLKYLELATEEMPVGDRRAAQILRLHLELGRTMGSSLYPGLGDPKRGFELLSSGIERGEAFVSALPD